MFAPILFVILVILNILDFSLTSMLVSTHGYEIEFNPILYHAMVYFDSTLPILIFKSIPIFLLGWALVYIHKTNHRIRKFTKIALIVLNVILLSVVILSIHMVLEGTI